MVSNASSPDDNSARQWQVRAVSRHGSVMTFGLMAASHDLARLTALDRIPFRPSEYSVTEVPPVERRG